MSGNSQQTVQDKWSQIRSAIRLRWPEVTADDLREISGDSRKLVALINQRTHAPLHEIEAGIDDIAASSGGLLKRLKEAAIVFAQDTTRSAQDAGRRLAEPLDALHRSGRQTVAEYPACSTATMFVTGLAVGLGLTLLLSSPAQKSSPWWKEAWPR